MPTAEELRGKFVLRMFDMFDGWLDLTGPLSKEEAEKKWQEYTKNGTEHTKYEDGDYYRVFEANTKMIYTPEFLGRD